jgi:hypothetical protein
LGASLLWEDIDHTKLNRFTFLPSQGDAPAFPADSP